MIKTLALTEDDYLTYYLYTASRSKKIQSNRRKSWLIISICFLVLGMLFINNNKFYAYYFFAFGIICFIFYPSYQSYEYKKRYKKHVSDNYQYKVGVACEINFQPDFIETKDATSESKFSTNEVVEINEISSHYFIKTRSGSSIILSKAAINSPSFITDLIAIFNNPNIVINKQLEWKWK
ncbi:SVM family protein [Mucilaginibacter sp. RCC_168]|uniref:hypothetical protein n=1 Tax=Mucilaginibacter sp. RCC_168 TaxID=3239221 RepID=UPI0035239F29